MEELADLREVTPVIRAWDEKHETENFDPEPYLSRLSEIIEAETEEYFKLDPDPFDDRHPSRTHPTCPLGTSLKALFKKENFVNKLVHEYLKETSGVKINTAACRLFIDILPGLEASVVYQETEGLILRLFNWAEHASEPLQSYALGLLGASMEMADVASKFKDKNIHLVPLMMQRLKDLQQEFFKNDISSSHHNGVNQNDSLNNSAESGLDLDRPFARFASCTKKNSFSPSPAASHSNTNKRLSRKRRRDEDTDYPVITPDSSSSWAELESKIIGNWKVYPITLATRQILTLRYLAPLGEYQEMLLFSFENHAIQLINRYLEKSKDSRLTFETLKYLAALLCHKKFANEFIQGGGLSKMLNIPRPSLAATGVSLCLYYIAYAEDAMEKVCLMSKSTLANLVAFVMWLMECSHHSSRNHALMFFSTVYPFKCMLDLFDAQEGLRRVLNVISTQKKFLHEPGDEGEEDSTSSSGDENQLLSRQSVRQVTFNLKRYFEAHLALLAEKLKRMADLNTPGIVHSPTPPYKAIHIHPSAQQKIVLELKPFFVRWGPVETFIKFGGIGTCMKILSLAYDWNYSGTGEIIRSVLEVLAICVLEPRVQLSLTEQFTISGSIYNGLQIVLKALDPDTESDPDVMRSALIVIGNCVCGPEKVETGQNLLDKTPNKDGSTASAKLGKKPRSSEELLNKMWECVRVNNGILTLTNLLRVQVPLTDADSLRALACWCLSGLARYRVVRQVLEQLPLLRNDELNSLMREPILQEKRQDHLLFQKYGLEIIKLVYGSKTEIDYIQKIQKSDLISQTRISYNQMELLELVQEYLLSLGLSTSAGVLASEAGLINNTNKERVKGSSTENLALCTPTKSTPKKIMNTPCSSQFLVNSKSRASLSMPPPATAPPPPATPQAKILGSAVKPGVPKEKITLDGIVKEYLLNQHSLCKTPMATCPEFTLKKPHKCPAPRDKSSANCLPSRFLQMQTMGRRDVFLERKLIYSRFKPYRVIRAETEDSFVSCAYSSCYQWTMVGTSQGDVKLFNNGSGAEDGTYQCHDGEIYNLQPNLRGTLLLTSSTWRKPLCALWRMEGLFDKLIEFNNEEYVEFSKVHQDKIVATQGERCYIYDVETKKRVSKFEPRMSNGYIKNRATFDPNDDLILSDGILWDVRSGNEIHKFDKLNENINGVFHPTGLEIISSSEVWDVRTWRLIKNVKALDQSIVTFTNDGSVIYGIKCDNRETSEGFKGADTSFVTLDATSYSSIGTYESKRSILCLSTSPNDLQIALVEAHNDSSSGDSVVRFYEVGRTRDGEDEVEEEEEEEEVDEDDEENDEEEDEDDENDLDRLLDEILPEGGGGWIDDTEEAEDTTGSDTSTGSNVSDSRRFVIHVSETSDEEEEDEEEEESEEEEEGSQ